MSGDVRIQAAMQELSQINLILTQRCINHAGEAAVNTAAHEGEIKALNAKIEELTPKVETPEPE